MVRSRFKGQGSRTFFQPVSRLNNVSLPVEMRKQLQQLTTEKAGLIETNAYSVARIEKEQVGLQWNRFNPSRSPSFMLFPPSNPAHCHTTSQ